MSIILGVLEEGLVYAIMALGVYITYKILDFPDLSVDGTFPLGGAITVTLILAGMNPAATLFIAFAVGALGRMHHRLYPCKIKGTGSSVRYYCHDCPLFCESADSR
jgi:ABC-type uncharacterized transport system permease subunit